MKQAQSTRRDFLKQSTLLAAAGSVLPYFPWSQPAFANNSSTSRPRIGCIGVGSMGTGDAHGHAGFGDILAVCDVDANHAERAKNDAKLGKGKADAYSDYRKVLERDDIDVVSVVTPDHWHVKIAIDAMRAGKDVYCEKPMTLTIREGQQIIKVMEETKKIVQVGTQQRTEFDQAFLKAIAIARIVDKHGHGYDVMQRTAGAPERTADERKDGAGLRFELPSDVPAFEIGERSLPRKPRDPAALRNHRRAETAALLPLGAVETFDHGGFCFAVRHGHSFLLVRI